MIFLVFFLAVCERRWRFCCYVFYHLSCVCAVGLSGVWYTSSRLQHFRGCHVSVHRMSQILINGFFSPSNDDAQDICEYFQLASRVFLRAHLACSPSTNTTLSKPSELQMWPLVLLVDAGLSLQFRVAV